MASSKDCQYFLKEKEIQKIKSEKNISYPEARKFVSAANDSPAQKSYVSVAKRVFNTVETQTMFTWIEDTEKPTRLTVKPKEKIITPSTQKSSSSQTATTSNTGHKEITKLMYIKWAFLQRTEDDNVIFSQS